MIEREIQSITQMARTILLSSEVPPTLWDEAIKTACFIRNRSPNKIVDTSPYETATKRKPALSHLCEFGRQIHVVIDDHYLRKFDPRTEEGFVVGFTMRSNTYRVYLRESKRVIESCNVIFKPHKQRANEAPKQTEAVTQVNIPQAQKSPLNAYFEDLAVRGFVMDDSFITAPDKDATGQGESPPEPQNSSNQDITLDSNGEVPSPDFSPITVHGDLSAASLEDTPQALLAATNCLEPTNYQDAMASESKDKWLKAIQEEFGAHERNGTWIAHTYVDQMGL